MRLTVLPSSGGVAEKNGRIFFIGVIVLLLLLISCSSAKRTRGPKWWRLGKTVDPSNLISNEILSNSLTDHHIPAKVLKLLRKRQRKLVRKNRGALSAVAEATEIAYKACESEFKDRRWNCSSIRTRKPSLFGKIVSLGCRETAFVYSITAASVLHTVTRACSQDTIQSCRCDYSKETPSTLNDYSKNMNYKRQMLVSNEINSPKGQSWKWDGCSENVKFGYEFSKRFVDSSEKGRTLASIMNLHNSEAGRLHVTTSMKSECKCHGMSGSCAMKTCWRRLPAFKRVAEDLKERFNGASHVIGTRELMSRPNDRRRSLSWKRSRQWRKLRKSFRQKNSHHKPPSRKDLIYVDKSPNFCVRNKKYGIPGTRGRKCNATSKGVDGCELMCCGRGYRSEVINVRERCSCSFEWCCEVKCKVCHKQKLLHTCR